MTAAAELLPHARPMLLVRSVLSHSPERTVCAVEVADSELFRAADGRVPAYVGLEYMAQCIAAHGGLAARALGRAPSPGLLVGAKQLALHREWLEGDESLEVSARLVGRAGALASFGCELRAGDELVAEGTLSVYVSDALA
jgi:predicted hotdog family 3-hydroxylacyl-ACP dehydratase